MRRRRALRRMMAVMLSVLMALMTAVPAFAEDGGLTTILDFFGEVTPESIAAGPNLIVLAHCSNPDCLVFPEAGDLTVVISHEGMEDIAVPVEKIEAEGDEIGLWIGAERIEQAILDEMAELERAYLEDIFGEFEEDDEEESEGEDALTEAPAEAETAEPAVTEEEKAEAPTETGEEVPETADAAEASGDEETADEEEEAADPAEDPAPEELTPEELADAVEDIYDLLSGYTFTLQGEDADHYTISEYGKSGFLITQDVFAAAVGLIAMIYEDELEEVETFAQLFQLLLNDMEEGMSEEERAAFGKLLDNIDPLMEFLLSSDFGGILVVDLTLDCGCPEATLFRIEHQYYRKSGDQLTFVGSVDEFYDESEYEEWLTDEGEPEEDMQLPEDEDEDWIDDEEWLDDDEPWPEDDSEDWEEDERFGPVGYGEAMTGDTVYAKDYIRPEYEGETYDYVGSYELYKTQTAEVVEFEGMGETHTYYWDAYMTEAGQWDDYALDALTLGDWWTEEYEQGLVLVYVLEEEQPEAVPKAGGFEPAPNTGDHSGAGLWLALLLSAAGCAGALAVRKKRG